MGHSDNNWFYTIRVSKAPPPTTNPPAQNSARGGEGGSGREKGGVVGGGGRGLGEKQGKGKGAKIQGGGGGGIGPQLLRLPGVPGALDRMVLFRELGQWPYLGRGGCRDRRFV